MGFAVVLIAMLLAALAVVDMLGKPEVVEEPRPRPPIPLPRQEIAKALKPPAETAPGAEPAPVVVVPGGYGYGGHGGYGGHRGYRGHGGHWR